MRATLWFRSPLRQGGLPIAGNALLHSLCRGVPQGLPRYRTCSFAKSPQCFSFRCRMCFTELLLPRDNPLAGVESDSCAQCRIVRATRSPKVTGSIRVFSRALMAVFACNFSAARPSYGRVIHATACVRTDVRCGLNSGDG